MSIATVRKAFAAAAALAALLVAQGILSGTAQLVAQAVIAVAGVFGVYRVPNARRASSDSGQISLGFLATVALVVIALILIALHVNIHVH